MRSIKNITIRCTLTTGLILALVGCATTKEDWKKASLLGTTEAYEQFLQNHSDSEQAKIARQRLSELQASEEWSKAESMNTIGGYTNFLDKYPQSKLVPVAKKALELASEKSTLQGIWFLPTDKQDGNIVNKSIVFDGIDKIKLIIEAQIGGVVGTIYDGKLKGGKKVKITVREEHNISIVGINFDNGSKIMELKSETGPPQKKARIEYNIKNNKLVLKGDDILVSTKKNEMPTGYMTVLDGKYWVQKSLAGTWSRK